MQERERRAIARDLHEAIGQQLTALKLVLDGADPNRPGERRSRLEPARAIAQEVIGRVRDLSLELCPSLLDDFGLVPALAWHVERFGARCGVRVRFEHEGLAPRYAADVETAVYRIVQEALTNVARHAEVDEVEVRPRAAGAASRRRGEP